jgi:hypothetical protein
MSTGSIPEAPEHVQELDLMEKLNSYAEGHDTWHADGSQLGRRAQQACRALHTGLIEVVEKVFAPMLSTIPAGIMRTFTLHDQEHAQKVAHLVWHILAPSRRSILTPPEIGMLVASAYLHDIGMALGDDERKERISCMPDMLDRLEDTSPIKIVIEALRQSMRDPALSEDERQEARHNLQQAEELLLREDTRERHALRERYDEVINKLDAHAAESVTKGEPSIPSVKSSLSYNGIPFYNALIDICVSHNEDARALQLPSLNNPSRPRFERDFPIGSTTADLLMIAAALRLADILDFDRERTPPVLYYHLLPPTTVGDTQSRSILEWNKHMAISDWQIDTHEILFRGQDKDHVVVHAVVEFCKIIEEEIKATRAELLRSDSQWPFILPAAVRADIRGDGHRYGPYRFSLDDQRIYEMLMGGAIYDNPLDAIRELLQNAVDACSLQDALMSIEDPDTVPEPIARITVRYEEPTDRYRQPRLIVKDSGVGMDAWAIDRWFLRVGQSYYRSREFNEVRAALRKANLNFSPVSEFGIGFLASFLLADYVVVETALHAAPPNSVGRDTVRRILHISGPTRLIRLEERRNDDRLRGTRVTLHLLRGSPGNRFSAPPTWEDVAAYIRDTCQDLPYSIKLVHGTGGPASEESLPPISRRPYHVTVPTYLEKYTRRVQFEDAKAGLAGEIALVNPYLGSQVERDFLGLNPSTSVDTDAADVPSATTEGLQADNESVLLRGGFKIGQVPGLPRAFLISYAAGARLRLTQEGMRRRELLPNLARRGVSDPHALATDVTRIWLSHLLERVDELGEGQLYGVWLDFQAAPLSQCSWLESFDAYTLYRLARNGWLAMLSREYENAQDLLAAWEKGEGDALKLGESGSSLYQDILDLVLPSITSGRELSAGGTIYVRPPRRGWQDTLNQCKNYVSAPKPWGALVTYTDKGENTGAEISHLLYYAFPGLRLLNTRYQGLLSDFSSDDLLRLTSLFERILDARTAGRPPRLGRSDLLLRQRIQDLAQAQGISIKITSSALLRGGKCYSISGTELPCTD